MESNINKLIVIGDIHGQTSWEDILEKHLEGPNDHAVFLGDYVDSFYVRPEDMIKNIDNLFALAGDDERIHLCIGNHDYHYIMGDYQRYSGYNSRFAWTYHSIFRDYDELLNIAYYFEKDGKRYICSHAGVTRTFLEDINTNIYHLNLFWDTNREAFGHKRGSPYGDDAYQSPLWVRPNSLIADAVPGCTQIVGHTWHDRPTRYDLPHDKDNHVWVICGEGEGNFAIF